MLKVDIQKGHLSKMKIIHVDILIKINYHSKIRLVPIISENCTSRRKEIILGVLTHSLNPSNWSAKAEGWL